MPTGLLIAEEIVDELAPRVPPFVGRTAPRTCDMNTGATIQYWWLDCRKFEAVRAAAAKERRPPRLWAGCPTACGGPEQSRTCSNACTNPLIIETVRVHHPKSGRRAKHIVCRDSQIDA